MFVLQRGGEKRKREDGHNYDAGGQAMAEVQETLRSDVDARAHLRENMVYNEEKSTGDLCHMVWQSASKSGSGVDPVWQLMMVKHLKGYAKDTVTLHAAARCMSKAQMLVRMSSFGPVVKYIVGQCGVPLYSRRFASRTGS